MIRKLLKKDKRLVALYQRLFLREKPSESHEHWVRIVMDRSTKEIISRLNYSNFSALEVSGMKWKDFGFEEYENLIFPEFDLCNQITEKKYDIIIAEQVFEHLTFPYKAGKNVYQMLNSGGYFLLTTPFLLKFHPDPIDCSRWTKEGLKYFLHECGFSLNQIKTDSWGNKECLISNLNDWTRYNPTKNSLRNEEEFPLVVWAIAKK